MALLYKLSKSVLPMLGLTLSIGMCYAFSLFSYVLTMLVGLFSSYWFLTFVLVAVYGANLLNVLKLKQLDRVS